MDPKREIIQDLLFELHEIMADKDCPVDDFRFVFTKSLLDAIVSDDVVTVYRLMKEEKRHLEYHLDEAKAECKTLSREQEQEQEPNEVAFTLPFADVKRYLSYLNYFPDSVLEPDREVQAVVAEYGWRNLLQKHVDTYGSLPGLQ